MNRSADTLFTLTAFVLFVLFVTSCKSSKSTTSTSSEKSRIYFEEAGRTESVDSMLHPYQLHIVRHFDIPTGAITTEEVKQVGELKIVTKLVTDTITVVERDTIRVDTSTAKYPAPTKTRAKISATLIGLLLGFAITITALFFIKFRRVLK